MLAGIKQTQLGPGAVLRTCVCSFCGVMVGKCIFAKGRGAFAVDLVQPWSSGDMCPSTSLLYRNWIVTVVGGRRRESCYDAGRYA